MPTNHKEPRHQEAGLNLSFIVALSSALAISLVMVGCAAIEFRQTPGLTIKQLFVEHLGYVLILGGVIHLATWLTLKLLLARQLNQIYVHLYGIGEGKLRPLHLTTHVREVKLLVDGINLMIWRVGRGQDHEAFAKAEKDLTLLRDKIKESTTENPALLADITEAMDSLERNFLALTLHQTNQTVPD